MSLVEEIKNNILEHKFTGVLFFDFADAFGLVNRRKLLYKLRKDFGIQGRLFLYLVSFLSGRQARITVNQLIGEWIQSEYGTSAGTVIGTVLFISYVHDAPSCIFPKFADDLAGLVSAADIVTVEESLQSILSQLNCWAEEWELQLNTSKTKVMLFGSQQVNLEA